MGGMPGTIEQVNRDDVGSDRGLREEKQGRASCHELTLVPLSHPHTPHLLGPGCGLAHPAVPCLSLCLCSESLGRGGEGRTW